MQHPEKKRPTKKDNPVIKLDKDISIIKGFFRFGEEGKWQKMEIMFNGNPFRPPILISKPGQFRPLTPIHYGKKK